MQHFASNSTVLVKKKKNVIIQNLKWTQGKTTPFSAPEMKTLSYAKREQLPTVTTATKNSTLLLKLKTTPSTMADSSPGTTKDTQFVTSDSKTLGIHNGTARGSQ